MKRPIPFRAPELAIVVFGAFLRISMHWTYPVRNGYDYVAHLPYVEWFARRFAFIPRGVTPEGYHPPLFYALAGGLVRLGAAGQALGGISILCGCLRLALIWLGVGLFVPSRLGRSVALGLAAVLPASVHLDGMVTNEGLNNLLAAGAMLLAALAFRAEGRQRVRLAAALGLALGAGLMTKVSALVLIGAVGAAGALELILRAGGGARARARRFLPWAGAIGLAFAISAPLLVHNHRLVGVYFRSGYDTWLPPEVAAKPVLARRPAAYFAGWSSSIFRSPYYPSGIEPRSRFWPVLLASTFSDYYNYSYCRPPSSGGDSPVGNGRRVDAMAFRLSRGSVAGGALIAVFTLAAWCVAFPRGIRDRDFSRAFLLLVPLFAVAGQAYFATKAPFDFEGVVKGVYMQFAAPPLCALFGAAVAWLWARRGPGRWLSAAGVAALAAVAAYTVYCRVPLPG